MDQQPAPPEVQTLLNHLQPLLNLCVAMSGSHGERSCISIMTNKDGTGIAVCNVAGLQQVVANIQATPVIVQAPAGAITQLERAAAKNANGLRIARND